MFCDPYNNMETRLKLKELLRETFAQWTFQFNSIQMTSLKDMTTHCRSGTTTRILKLVGANSGTMLGESGCCDLNKGECDLNQSKDDSFFKRVSKSNN